MRCKILLLNATIILFLINCDNPSNRYAVRGTIRSLELNTNKVVIAHDTIADLMPPMVMPFFVPGGELNQVKVGDSVLFEFVWNDSLPFAHKFSVVGRGYMPEDDDFFDDEYSEKSIGDVIDDVTLLTIDSINYNLSQSDGKYRFISYIFTRCPMPNMCPAVIMKNNVLANNFSESNLIEFLLISFDYIHDTPSVLRRNYSSIIEQNKNVIILSSTGRIEDIYSIVRQTGANFWGVEEEKIGHTMRSVLIDPNRKLLASWPGDDWNVNHAENAIKLMIK